MIKTIIRRLFLSDQKRNEIDKDLKSNPYYRTTEEIRQNAIDLSGIPELILEKGKIESIFTPELGNQKGLSLTKWYFKPGDIIKSGDIVCEIENENITMEFESIYSGRILSTCKPKQKLTSGTEIFRIEGI